MIKHFLPIAVAIFAVIFFRAEAQVITSNQTKPASDLASEKINPDNIDFSISRQEDIYLFENNMKMFQNALDVKSMAETEVFLNKNLVIARREIARAKINLNDLKAGDTKHLEEWRKQNGISEPLNITLEINRLNDNIKSMEYMYNDLKKANLDKLSDSRTTATWLGDMKILLKNMNKNLKYESDKKIIHVEKPPHNDSLNTEGTAIITQVEQQTQTAGNNPLLNDFYTAQAERKASFSEEKTNYQNQLQQSDYKSARRTYKSILQTMQSEIDANMWLKSIKDAESDKMATINVDEVGPIIAKQQKILDEAMQIKVPSNQGSDFNPAQSLELLEEFENTLH